MGFFSITTDVPFLQDLYKNYKYDIVLELILMYKTLYTVTSGSVYSYSFFLLILTI